MCTGAQVFGEATAPASPGAAVIGSHEFLVMWVLGTEHRLSVCAVSTLNCCDIFPSPIYCGLSEFQFLDSLAVQFISVRAL